MHSTQLLYVRCILLCFDVVSGLKINLDKLEVSLVIEVVNLEELAPFLDIRHLTFH